MFSVPGEGGEGMTGTGNDGDGSQADGRVFFLSSCQVMISYGGQRVEEEEGRRMFFVFFLFSGIDGRGRDDAVIIASALEGSSCHCTCTCFRLSGRE